MKKVFGVLVFVLALGLAASTFAQTKVLSGTWGVNSETNGYTLKDKEGNRSMTINVNFLDPFENKPDVILGVQFFDADSKAGIRYNVEALSISRDGMTIKITTWGDSKIYGISGTWLAHGE